MARTRPKSMARGVRWRAGDGNRLTRSMWRRRSNENLYTYLRAKVVCRRKRSYGSEPQRILQRGHDGRHPAESVPLRHGVDPSFFCTHIH
jgi:hypothetical protein